jgi:hypothetical protein
MHACDQTLSERATPKLFKEDDAETGQQTPNERHRLHNKLKRTVFGPKEVALKRTLIRKQQI